VTGHNRTVTVKPLVRYAALSGYGALGDSLGPDIVGNDYAGWWVYI
jgi:hypothetical protein